MKNKPLAENKSNRFIDIREPGIISLGIFMAILSAIICMQIMGQLGITPNTSLIGAVLVMIFARLPMKLTQRFRHPERQNYVLSMASAAGFAAANCGFVAIATIFILGRNDLILPIALGSLMGCLVSVFTAGRLFDSQIFPARGAWPMGQAVATTIEAGDKGGRKAIELCQGLAVGAVASLLGIPAAGVGIAFIADMVTLAALAGGILLRGFSTYVFNGFDIGGTNIAQGIMIGAGIVALGQIIRTISKGNRKHTNLTIPTDESTAITAPTVNDNQAKKTLFVSIVLHTLCVILLAAITGVFGEMGISMGIAWVAFAGFATFMTMVLVGTASMHSGWAPGFAVVTLFLTIGMLLGFPMVPLVVLVGYLGAVGMPIHDTGIGLKTGWLIRNKNANPAHESFGRRQQVLIKYLGAIIGIGVSLIFGIVLLNNDVVPPMSLFYATTVAEAINPTLLRELALWAIPGAALQAAFGNKSVGLMLATGLLINNPIFGIALMAAIVVRRIFGAEKMAVRAPGLIAGDGLVGFGMNIWRVF
ncbi:MAG: OPT/YSL family transporter [Defluviitaleaceae bacterium]|nr:OPT/YSL family transporter [Defluviitaleaceae bacterium]